MTPQRPLSRDLSAPQLSRVSQARPRVRRVPGGSWIASCPCSWFAVARAGQWPGIIRRATAHADVCQEVAVEPVFICGGGPPVPDTTSDCPDRDRHTPQPHSYVDRSMWAEAMLAAGAEQRRCPACHKWAIWTEPIREVRYP